MRARRSHRKSRRGCVTCKQRRVKCDEKKPTCGACSIRATPCEYEQPTELYLSLEETKYDHTPDSPAKESGGPTTSGVASATIGHPAFQGEKRMLELQLMNRWSTVTYKSMCTPVTEDDAYWHTKVPEWSLQYDFVLNGLFALAAFEVASSTPRERDRKKYADAAIQYQTAAIGNFRSHLSSNQVDHEAIFAFSFMLMVLALATPQFLQCIHGESFVRNSIFHFEILRGCDMEVECKANFLTKNPYTQRMKQLQELPPRALLPQSEIAILKLREANDRRVSMSVGESYEERVKHVSFWEACKKAILALRDGVERCTDPNYSGYVLGFLNVAGVDYVEAVRSGDRIALLILMHWGVLVEKLSYEVWWAKRFGGLLIAEISRELLEEAADAETKELIDNVQTMLRMHNDKIVCANIDIDV